MTVILHAKVVHQQGVWENRSDLLGALHALCPNDARNERRDKERQMAQCNGKGCRNFLNAADEEASSLLIAASIPTWMVKRPERRAPYARRVYGPRCQVCRSKLIKELHG